MHRDARRDQSEGSKQTALQSSAVGSTLPAHLVSIMLATVSCGITITPRPQSLDLELGALLQQPLLQAGGSSPQRSTSSARNLLGERKSLCYTGGQG